MNACHRKSPEQLKKKKKAEAAKHDTGTEKRVAFEKWEKFFVRENGCLKP